jgi:hypothetical protein
MTDLLNVLNGQPPANIKGNSNMPNALKSHSNPLPEGPVVLTFWPPCLGIALATPGQQKVKKSSSATFATRAKRAVDQCLKIHERIGISNI